MPTNLVRDGVTFQLGPTNDGAYNAVACQGQTIALWPPGTTISISWRLRPPMTDTGTFTVNGQATDSDRALLLRVHWTVESALAQER